MQFVGSKFMAPASVEISEHSTENTWTEVYYYYLEDSVLCNWAAKLTCDTLEKFRIYDV